MKYEVIAERSEVYNVTCNTKKTIGWDGMGVVRCCCCWTTAVHGTKPLDVNACHHLCGEVRLTLLNLPARWIIAVVTIVGGD